MRVMGASRIRIFSVIILEGFLLALLGATLGLLAGHSALSGIWFNEAISRNGISALFFSSTEWYIFCLAILVGIFGSLLPAIRAAKADVHSILTR
jgi:putative ABC transport system permease protein